MTGMKTSTVGLAAAILRRRALPVLLATALVVLAVPAYGGIEADLRNALDLHEKASSLAEQRQALEAFHQVAAEYPKHWRAHFWTAYEETQIHMLHTRSGDKGDSKVDLGSFLNRAQEHLNTAQNLHTEATAREKSSFAALQSLIYGFRAGFDKENAEDWKARSKAALRQGAALDPDNPAVTVMVSTGLVSKAQQASDWATLSAACRLLRLAQAEANEIEDRVLSTYFNSEWIPFWLPYAEKSLGELQAEQLQDGEIQDKT